MGMHHRAHVSIDRRRAQRNAEADVRDHVRACCNTAWSEAHAGECRRSSKCREKVAFSFRRAAKRAARESSRMYATTLTKYRCPDCELYHIGRPQPGQRGSDL